MLIVKKYVTSTILPSKKNSVVASSRQHITLVLNFANNLQASTFKIVSDTVF